MRQNTALSFRPSEASGGISPLEPISKGEIPRLRSGWHAIDVLSCTRIALLRIILQRNHSTKRRSHRCRAGGRGRRCFVRRRLAGGASAVRAAARRPGRRRPSGWGKCWGVLVLGCLRVFVGWLRKNANALTKNAVSSLMCSFFRTLNYIYIVFCTCADMVFVCCQNEHFCFPSKQRQ